MLSTVLKFGKNIATLKMNIVPYDIVDIHIHIIMFMCIYNIGARASRICCKCPI